MTRTLQLALATSRPRRPVPGRAVLDPSVTRLRVRASDLDLYRHVNNGVYLQMMDVARTHYLADLGAFGLLTERGWYPVVAASTVTYRRSLTWRQQFTITTRVLGWDPRVVYLEQVFARGEQHVARGWVAGRFLSRRGDRVPAPDVVALLDHAPPAPPHLPDDVAAWARAVDVAHR
ncbi:acyl-CoA thioesterase [Cellulomonas shaoxiangyii]|uniref:Acyl-CoA thioesterase n=1 Tax=Cellulomonas shaoxiangyii TaxID=2566013 RepID=A0A4P7SI28_9CELL|nr:acyl-CoA thioesterase [Cellulomonas shaoxiangyii]QCB93391.1 acyl-CoA thioesterase [Cellulomonas shaoxiangyii]TGY77319.1 acyl-CoA thioesterase [Cellulomonas shaoxiangyii]